MRGWLFDLDGTLVDTAYELADAFNATFRQNQLPTQPIARLRPLITEGTNAILQHITGITDNNQLQTLRQCVLDHYQTHLGKQCQLFTGIETVLDTLDKQHIPWGIVTNKLQQFTYPLLETLQLDTRSQCIICADSLPYKKPHPAPLLHASDQLDIPVSQCVYIGDSYTDIQAAIAAHMQSIAVRYGYHRDDDDIDSWGADHVIDEATDLLGLLKNS